MSYEKNIRAVLEKIVFVGERGMRVVIWEGKFSTMMPTDDRAQGRKLLGRELQVLTGVWNRKWFQYDWKWQQEKVKVTLARHEDAEGDTQSSANENLTC